MSVRPTCFVIGNCTHKPIQAYLSATGLFSAVDSMALFTVKKDQFDEAYARVKAYDYVFSIAHGRIWGPFSFDACKADLGNRLVLFTTPFFNGLHPDVIYVSNGPVRAQSLLGDYHSGLVFWGFMAGRPRWVRSSICTMPPSCRHFLKSKTPGPRHCKRWQTGTAGRIFPLPIYMTGCAGSGPQC